MRNGPTPKDSESYTKNCSYNEKPQHSWLDKFMAGIDPPDIEALSTKEKTLADEKSAENRRRAQMKVAKQYSHLLKMPAISSMSARSLSKSRYERIIGSSELNEEQKRQAISTEFVGIKSQEIRNEFNNLKRESKSEYQGIMQANPYLYFIKSAEPSDAEISNAFAELEKIASQEMKNVKEAKLTDIAEFPDSIDAAIRNMDDSVKGDICQMAHYALLRKDTLENGKIFILGGMSLLTLPLGMTVAAGFGAAEMAASGLVQLTNVRAEHQRCLASIEDPVQSIQSQCRQDKLDTAEDSLALTALLSPLAVIGLGSAARATSKGLNAAEELALEAEERAIKATKISEAGGELTNARNLLQTDKARYVSEMKNRLRSRLDEIVPKSEQNAPAKIAKELLDKAISEADEPKEIASLFHQMNIMNTRRSQVTRALGGDEDGSLLLSIVVSDLGKLKTNSQLLVGKGDKAFVDMFFNCARLKKEGCDPKVFDAFEEYLNRSGRIDQKTGELQTLLNKDMSQEEIQQIFSSVPYGGFQRAMKHELPGVAYTFQLLKEGKITKDQFMRVMHFNIGHNGPGNLAADSASAIDEIDKVNPFWGLGAKIIAPNMASKADEAAKAAGIRLNAARLDDGTIFSRWVPKTSKADAGYINDYPDPMPFLTKDSTGVMRYHYELYDHLFKDRVEGAYSGAGKFVMEGKDSPMPITAAFDSMVTNNPLMTAGQVRYARRGLEEQYKKVESILGKPKSSRTGEEIYYTADDLRKIKYLIEKGKQVENHLTQMNTFLKDSIQTVKGSISNGKFIPNSAGEDSIRVAKYMDDQGRDVIATIHESFVEINRGGKITAHQIEKGKRAEVIETVLSTVADEVYTYERAISESGNILRYLILNP